MSEVAIAAPSPFSDPHYGEAAEHGLHTIASNPRWTLEENQGVLTGWVGALVIVAGGFFCASFALPPHPPESWIQWLSFSAQSRLYRILDALWEWRHPLLILAVFFSMFLVETLGAKVHRRHFNFEAPRNLDGQAWRRIGARWLAVCTCVGLAALFYTLLGEYNLSFYDLHRFLFEGATIAQRGQNPEPHEIAFNFYHRYYLFGCVAGLTLIALSAPYFWLVERYARPDGPADEFLIMAHCLRRALAGFIWPSRRQDAGSAMRNPHLHNLLRGMLVKFFFIPLMLMWSLSGWGNVETATRYFVIYGWSGLDWADSEKVCAFVLRSQNMLINIIFLIDLVVALVGYVFSLRLLDNHITSAEPTFLGWAVALLCYPPFNDRIDSLYFPYGSDQTWLGVLSASPYLLIPTAVLVVALLFIYSWATISFGLRFSNLTNRGILCRGPYAYVRHPAYIAKNLSWWIQCLPFLASAPLEAVLMSLHLLAVNGIYALRAWTEERHLMREPHYRAYCEKVRWRFIPKIW